MAKYKLTLEVDDWANVHSDTQNLEIKIMDLIRAAVLPTLDLQADTYQLTKKRG